jgi:hypothetical protein
MIVTTCMNCKNYILGKECNAFKSIPNEIWEGENGHEKPLPEQDNNIVFEEI